MGCVIWEGPWVWQAGERRACPIASGSGRSGWKARAWRPESRGFRSLASRSHQGVREHYIIIKMVAEGVKELILWPKYKKWNLLWLDVDCHSHHLSLSSIRRKKRQRRGNEVGLDRFQGVAVCKTSWHMILRKKHHTEVTTRGSWGSHPRTTENSAGLQRVSKDASSISFTNKENEVHRGKVTEPRSHSEVGRESGYPFLLPSSVSLGPQFLTCSWHKHDQLRKSLWRLKNSFSFLNINLTLTLPSSKSSSGFSLHLE